MVLYFLAMFLPVVTVMDTQVQPRESDQQQRAHSGADQSDMMLERYIELKNYNNKPPYLLTLPHI